MLRTGLAVAAIALAGMAACNRVFGLDPPVDRDGADGADDAAIDADLGQFVAAHAITNTPGVYEDDPTLSHDLSELYYSSSSMTAGKDIMRATPIGDGWSAGVPVVIVDTNVVDGTPRLGAGELTLYYGSDRPGGPGLTDVWATHRASPQDAWQVPALVPALSSAGDDRTPSPCQDDQRFILMSNRDGASRLWEVVPGVSATAIDTGALEPQSPFVSDDCRVLYFAGRTAVDLPFHLFVISRPQIDAPWTAPRPIPELDSAEGEQDPWLSPDQRLLVFARVVGGQSHLWEAIR